MLHGELDPLSHNNWCFQSHKERIYPNCHACIKVPDIDCTSILDGITSMIHFNLTDICNFLIPTQIV